MTRRKPPPKVVLFPQPPVETRNGGFAVYGVRTWCDQCAVLVSNVTIEACESRFCSLRAKV